jgi:regulatory protein
MNYKEALKYAMDLCSRQERCRSEIAGKLEARNVSPGDTEKILQALSNENFIDEQRYSNAFSRDKLKFNKWGKMKIRHMLKAKQIPESIVESALAELDEDYYLGILREELMKKRKKIKGGNAFEIRGKLFRFASQRGFESGDIHKLLDEAL